MNNIVIGVYFAQDDVIVAAMDPESGTMQEPIRERANRDGIENIKHAARLITENFAHQKVQGICQAVPSTIRVLEKYAPDYGDIGVGIGPRDWSAMNAVSEIRDALRFFEFPLDFESCKFPIISQVGATALGDFSIRHPNAFSGSGSAIERRTTGNVIHLVADHGIGCAILERGRLFHGQAVPNIGHMLVRPLRGEIYKQCRHHPDRSCLNSMASLGAIQARWGMSAHEFITCRDVELVTEVAHYFAQVFGNLIFLCSPTEIVVGGRMSRNSMFIEQLRTLTRMQLAGKHGQIPDPFDKILAGGELIKEQAYLDAGVLGACLLAQKWSVDDNVRRLEF